MPPSKNSKSSQSQSQTQTQSQSLSGTPLKQQKLVFQSTKRSNSIQDVGKGKQPARTASAPVTNQLKRQASVVESGSESEDDPALVQSKKRKLQVQDIKSKSKADNKQVSDSGEKVVFKRQHLNPGDRKWAKQYAFARRQMGGLVPVHGANQTKVDHILRVFDLSYEYGPCAGLSRLQRWERADALGLNPPPEVHEILMTEEGTVEPTLRESVFFGDV